LTFLEAGRVYGMRYYSKANDPNQAVAYLCDFDALDNEILATRQFVNPPGDETARWRNTWFHPTVRVVLGKTYEALVLFPVGGYFRTVNRLAESEDHQNNGIDFSLGVILTGLNVVTGARTVSNDGYGVDVLFMPDAYVPVAFP